MRVRDSLYVVEGNVKQWNDDEGWGVLVSPDGPGEVWAHFSHIVGGDETAYRSLSQGESVLFEWVSVPGGQDGYSYRATRVMRPGDQLGHAAG